jgi:hypothetical protein
MEDCRPHIERIYKSLNDQHKQKMAELHAKLSGIHNERMTELHNRAKEKIQIARERISSLKDAIAQGAGSQHHAALSNEVERVRRAWLNRNKPGGRGHLTTTIGRLMDFHASTLSGRDTKGRIANPMQVLARYRGMQRKGLK